MASRARTRTHHGTRAGGRSGSGSASAALPAAERGDHERQHHEQREADDDEVAGVGRRGRRAAAARRCPRAARGCRARRTPRAASASAASTAPRRGRRPPPPPLAGAARLSSPPSSTPHSRAAATTAVVPTSQRPVVRRSRPARAHEILAPCTGGSPTRSAYEDLESLEASERLPLLLVEYRTGGLSLSIDDLRRLFIYAWADGANPPDERPPRAHAADAGSPPSATSRSYLVGTLTIYRPRRGRRGQHPLDARRGRRARGVEERDRARRGRVERRARAPHGRRQEPRAGRPGRRLDVEPGLAPQPSSSRSASAVIGSPAAISAVASSTRPQTSQSRNPRGRRSAST